jgi:hypothetical protein
MRHTNLIDSLSAEKPPIPEYLAETFDGHACDVVLYFFVGYNNWP